ncbi:hypothetical protein EZV73_01970 [Acidaminobacter sp. JC074]|uniref:hypothetical protein n=1 Tax=Acidaminobacter sp. JC074 TaxID=2530199 RepID=UPI00216EB207|nr:hypothetical protein [Acidaminobacter sp. JC074]
MSLKLTGSVNKKLNNDNKSGVLMPLDLELAIKNYLETNLLPDEFYLKMNLKEEVSDYLMESIAAEARISKKRSLTDLILEKEDTFQEMLFRLIDEAGLKDSEVYRKANIDRRHFSKIRSNVDYQPKKDTVLSFAIALELSLDQTKDLLMKAGYALSRSSKFDLIIEYFLLEEEYDIFLINEALFKFTEKTLS